MPCHALKACNIYYRSTLYEPVCVCFILGPSIRIMPCNKTAATHALPCGIFSNLAMQVSKTIALPSAFPLFQRQVGFRLFGSSASFPAFVVVRADKTSFSNSKQRQTSWRSVQSWRHYSIQLGFNWRTRQLAVNASFGRRHNVLPPIHVTRNAA